MRTHARHLHPAFRSSDLAGSAPFAATLAELGTIADRLATDAGSGRGRPRAMRYTGRRHPRPGTD